MTFNIEPLSIAQTAVQLTFNVISTSDTTATVYYELKREDGINAEIGNKEIPIQALQILGQVPINISYLNQVLAGFNIVATEQVLPETISE
jgi:hypothetical protein